MITAAEALEQTKEVWVQYETEIGDALLEADTRVRENLAKGYLQCTIGSYPPAVAEAVAYELETIGFTTHVVNPRMVDAEIRVEVVFNWKYLSNTRMAEESRNNS